MSAETIVTHNPSANEARFPSPHTKDSGGLAINPYGRPYWRTDSIRNRVIWGSQIDPFAEPTSSTIELTGHGGDSFPAEIRWFSIPDTSSAYLDPGEIMEQPYHGRLEELSIHNFPGLNREHSIVLDVDGNPVFVTQPWGQMSPYHITDGSIDRAKDPLYYNLGRIGTDILTPIPGSNLGITGQKLDRNVSSIVSRAEGTTLDSPTQELEIQPNSPFHQISQSAGTWQSRALPRANSQEVESDRLSTIKRLIQRSIEREASARVLLIRSTHDIDVDLLPSIPEEQSGYPLHPTVQAFGEGIADIRPEEHTRETAALIVEAATMKAVAKEIEVDDEDGALSFELRLDRGLLVVGELSIEGNLHINVYNDRHPDPDATIDDIWIKHLPQASVDDLMNLL